MLNRKGVIMSGPIIPNKEDWMKVGLPGVPTEEALNGYEEVYPGSKGILLDEAQKWAEHRMQMQRRREFSLLNTIVPKVVSYFKRKIGA